MLAHAAVAVLLSFIASLASISIEAHSMIYNEHFARQVSHREGGLHSLSSLPKGDPNKPDAHRRYYQQIPSPSGHVSLIGKIIFGTPLIPIGLWISINALRRRTDGHDDFGLLIFLSGGVIGALGFMILIS